MESILVDWAGTPAQPSGDNEPNAHASGKPKDPTGLEESSQSVNADPRRLKFLNDYKAQAGKPSSKRIYTARNSGINKPEFYEWLRGDLPDTSVTTIKFEKFLRKGSPPIPKK